LSGAHLELIYYVYMVSFALLVTIYG